MKKTNKYILLALLIALGVACQGGSSKSTPESVPAVETPTQATTMADSTQSHICPMHKDIVGRSGDKCSKCAMALVDKNSLKPDAHKGHNH